MHQRHVVLQPRLQVGQLGARRLGGEPSPNPKPNPSPNPNTHRGPNTNPNPNAHPHHPHPHPHPHQVGSQYGDYSTRGDGGSDPLAGLAFQEP